MTVEQVMDEIRRDVIFYDQSGGGVTFSGGEPLLQGEFLLELLRACKLQDLHTVVDTCGFASVELLDRIAPYVDLFLYDLKLIDSDCHRKVTGAPNGVILDNLRRLADHQIVLRIPIIPRINDDEDNLKQIGALVSRLPNIQRVDILAYHKLGSDKYERLGRPNPMPETEPPTGEMLAGVKSLLESYGLGDKPIWLTEFGWLRDPAESGVNCQGDPALAGFEWMRVPLATQAEYTVRAFAYADRYWPWAGPMFLWNLDWQRYGRDIEPACSHLRWFSLLESDGTPTDTYRAVAAMPRRVSAYRPRLEARPLLLPGQTLSAGNVPTYPLAAFCPNAVAVGQFQIVNTGWPAQVTIAVEPAALDAPGMPGVAVSAAQARFGDRVVIYAAASDTPPGVYLLVVNLRTTFEGRPLSGNARVLLQVENSPINCPA
jgi:pyruvate-formate lyase-activating enzyme